MVIDEMPEMKCPECGHVEPDLDGFGLVSCTKCSYCTHSAVADGRCEFCGSEVETNG